MFGKMPRVATHCLSKFLHFLAAHAWLDAEGGGPLPVDFFTFLVVHFWLNAEGGGPLPVDFFTFLVVHFWIDAEGGGPNGLSMFSFFVLNAREGRHSTTFWRGWCEPDLNQI